MHLRWQDFDFHAGRITWCREHDKTRKQWVVAYPEALLATVRECQLRLGVVGGPVPATRQLTNGQRRRAPVAVDCDGGGEGRAG